MNNEERKSVARALRRGFTLIEIMVAVAIVGIMSTLAVVQVMGMLESAKVDAAQSAVMTVKQTVGNYYIKYKRYPSDISALIQAQGSDDPMLEGGEGAIEDPWGTQLKMEGKGSKIVVICAGPDTEFGTEDDIRSDKVKKTSKGN